MAGSNSVRCFNLGLDHSYDGGRPLLFETMVFNNSGDSKYLERYSNWEEAEEGHKRAVKWVTSSQT